MIIGPMQDFGKIKRPNPNNDEHCKWSKTELVKVCCGTIPYEFDQKKFQTRSVTEQKVQVKFNI